jgi:hypothetical protein
MPEHSFCQNRVQRNNGTPLIALTEQKYREIQAALERWGYSEHYVGLVTGNRRENPEQPILVVVAKILVEGIAITKKCATLRLQFVVSVWCVAGH